MSSSPEKLIYMANQIGKFFHSQGHERAVQGISEHCEVHPPAAIKTLHDRLSQSSPDEIMLGFDAAKFNRLDIYPGGWDVSAKQYVEERLKAFLIALRRAADGNFGMLVVII